MDCTNCQADLGDATAREASICVDVAGDEYIYSYWRCEACGCYTLETYRDRFVGDAASSVDGPIDADEGAAMADFIRQCPEPNNKHCDCAVHRRLAPHSDEAPPAEAEGPVLIKCPECLQPTDSLKRYGVMHQVVFVVIAARSTRRAYTACPKCMRRKVLKDTFSPLNMLLANLMWILAVFPYCIGILIASRIPGHSKAVRKAMGLES